MRRAEAFLLCAVLLVITAVVVPRASADSPSEYCSRKIVSYQDGSSNRARHYVLYLGSSGAGRLLYAGVVHTYDPDDLQFSWIEFSWNMFKPTMAFFEGTGSSVGNTRDYSIKTAGEPGLVRYLAARDGIPAFSLEPKIEDEVQYTLGRFSAEQVKLFYVLRQVAQLRTRQNLSEAGLKSRIQGILQQWSRVEGLQYVITSVEELEAAYNYYWKSPVNWWEASMDWFSPLRSSSETGGVFMNEVNQESSHYRNLHIYNMLAKAVREGGIVFAAVGRDHIPMQEEALRCILK